MTARQKILMCAPDYFGVDYVINAWMKNQIGQADHKKAQAQWENLRAALATETDIELLPPQKGVPDLVFTANAGMVLGDKVIVSRFRDAERRLEEPFNTAWFEKSNLKIVPWPQHIAFEGAGDALLDRSQPIVWMGYGFRSEAAAAPEIEKIFGRRVISLQLVDPYFYHLDTCLCPLPRGWLMYYPPAFDDKAQAAIAALVPEEKRIVVGAEDASAFNCNAVDLNGRVFLNAPTPALQEKLRGAGFSCTVTPLSEFIKAGGASKCLTLKLVET